MPVNVIRDLSIEYASFSGNVERVRPITTDVASLEDIITLRNQLGEVYASCMEKIKSYDVKINDLSILVEQLYRENASLKQELKDSFDQHLEREKEMLNETYIEIAKKISDI